MGDPCSRCSNEYLGIKSAMSMSVPKVLREKLEIIMINALTVCQGEAASCLYIANGACELVPRRVSQHHPHVQAGKLACHGDTSSQIREW